MAESLKKEKPERSGHIKADVMCMRVTTVPAPK